MLKMERLESQITLKCLEAIKPKGINRIAKISLREENKRYKQDSQNQPEGGEQKV